jgi:hypothetical protein
VIAGRWFNARFRSSLRLRRAESGGRGDLSVFLARPRRGSPLNRRIQPNTQSVPFFAGPRVLNRPHSITATVEIPDDGAQGPLVCQGHCSGWLLAIHQGRHAALRPQLLSAAACTASQPRTHCQPARTSCFEFEPTGQADLPHGRGAPGRCSSTSTGALVADADTPVTTPFVLNPGGLTCGANPGSPVTLDYPSPFRFTGTLRKVTVDVSGEGGWALLGSNQ